MRKRCFKCKQTKPFSEFHKDKYEPDGHTTSCKKCRRAYQVAWMARPAVKKHRAKLAREFRRTEFGKQYTRKVARITMDNTRFGGLREVVLENAGYKCSICGTSKSLCVHHKDGKGRNSTEPNNTLENLQVMCLSCHMKLHRKLEKLNCES